MTSCAKPWLAAAILHKFTRQIAGATRVAQNQLKRADCVGNLKEIFATADLVVLALRDAIQALETPTLDAQLDSTGEAKSSAS